MKTAWLRLSNEILIDALGLPADTKILGAEMGYMQTPLDTVCLLVSHEDLPPLDYVKATFQMIDGEVQFVRWTA
jgi:hypothetical protein